MRTPQRRRWCPRTGPARAGAAVPIAAVALWCCRALAAARLACHWGGARSECGWGRRLLGVAPQLARLLAACPPAELTHVAVAAAAA
eukprot:14598565-Alexandrium_andersonii.AAC.1